MFNNKIENIDDIAYKLYVTNITNIYLEQHIYRSVIYLDFNSFIFDSIFENNYEIYYKIYYDKAKNIIRKRKIKKLNDI